MNQDKYHHLHRYDPDWEAAQRHGIANRTGIVKKNETLSEGQQVCRCCGQHFQKEPVNLWSHSKQLQFLGFGFPLFYQFLKYCIVLLIVHIGTYSAMSLQQAVEHNKTFCHGATLAASSGTSTATTQVAHKCYTFMIELARIEDYQTTQELSIRCIAFGIHLLALIYVRNLLTKMEGYYDERTTTLSDYALTIKGIDLPDGNVKKTIADYFQKISGDVPPQLNEIILLPHFAKIQQLSCQRKKILSEMRKYYATHEVVENEELDKKIEQLNAINKEMIKSAHQSFGEIQEDKLSVQRAIIIFESQTEKLRMKKLFRSSSIHDLRETFGHYWRLRINEAPNPEQIIWENFSIPKKTRALRILLGWTLSVLVLAAVFIAFYFILVGKAKILEDATYNIIDHPSDSQYQTQYNGAVAIVFILMFLVVLFNKLVLSFLFHIFTELEVPSTVSTLQFSFALKYSLGLFFTTAIMSLAVEAIKFENYYSHPYGVVDEESIMFGMNAIFVPLFWLVNPLRIYKIIKRKLKKGSKNMTQLQANELMEEDSYDLGKRFGEVIETMWFVFLYSTLLPIGAVVSIMGLILYYWVDKYNLLRRSKVHGNVSGKFIRTSMLLLDFTLILKPIGSLIFDLHLRNIEGSSYLPSNIVMICIAFVYIVFPKYGLIKFFNSELFDPEQKLYSEVKSKFDEHNYTTHHPLFKVLHTEQQNRQDIIRKLKTINSIEKPPQVEPVIPTSVTNILKKHTDTSDVHLLQSASL